VSEITALLTDPTDAELVARCAARDERAWSELVVRYRRLVHAIPSRAGLSADDAEEIFQETFARLATQIGSLQDGDRVRAWIVTTARRLTIDLIRSRISARRLRDSVIRLDELSPPAADLPSFEIEQLEEQHLVRRALARLDVRSRRVLEVFFYAPGERPNYREIAKELGMAVGSLGPTRARCLQKLRNEYERLVAESSELPISRCA
jgi:RNA polymerase sigma factor (sigma-70 family)